ncbi:MAG: hypothetical protein H0U23_18030, partial [Blastocatellia bacterium]|nr:hypothetical protein [Blastocatellia bacterium]
MLRITVITLLVCGLIFCAACSKTAVDGPAGNVSALSELPAVRLNFRYEADVPPPDPSQDVSREERNAAVQADFDASRPQEVLDNTYTSPDAKRVLAVYHKANDLPSEFRLDMYTADGRILRKITADAMAVHFPGTIRWSPDSSTVAFVAMVRGSSVDETATGPVTDPETSVAPTNQNTQVAPPAISPDANANTDVVSNVNTDPNATAVPTPAAPTGILTFRTEQIYICGADGDTVRALTQNEGLIYFYYVWSPDSTMLAAVAAKSIEWRYLSDRAEMIGEVFTPLGRPRVIEKNGRERRLDDALTAVQPVWSPDSAKIACAFDSPSQASIYDAGGNGPTQAAIPLRNHLLISSQMYDREQAAKLETNAVADPNANSNVNSNVNSNAAPVASSNSAGSGTLPDEKTLVSYN